MKKLKNIFISLIINFLKKFIKKNTFDNANPRFLIISTTALGDTLWSTPFLESIKNTYPSAFIGLLTSRIGKDILENNPYVDKIYYFKKTMLLSFIPLFFKLKKSKIQVIFSFHASQRLALPLCSIIGAETIIGSQNQNKGLDHLLSKAIETKEVHEIERRKLLLQHFNIQTHKLSTQFYLSKTANTYIEELLRNKKILKKPLIILHPGSKDKFKRWPKKSFIELGNLLVKKLKATIIITGNKEEKRLVAYISKKIIGSYNFSNKLTISQLASLINKSDFFITNDTGPMHLSASIQIKTIAIFCSTEPKNCGPNNDDHVLVISKHPSCFPCRKRKCHEPFCFYQIPAMEVFNKMNEKWMINEK